MIAFRRSRSREPIPMAAREPQGVASLPIAELALYAVMAISVVLASLIDIPRAWRAGSMTWLGMITVIECVVGTCALLLARTLPRRIATLNAPFVVLMLWTALSTSWAPPRSEGLQNAAVYLSFLVLLTVSAVAAAADRASVERILGAAIVAADVIGLCLVAASLAFRGWPTNIDVVPWFVHPRALSLFGLVPLGWHLSRWVLGSERAAVPAFLWVAAIFVSLSRTATACALLLVLLAVLARSGTKGLKLRSNYLLMALVPLVVVGVLTIAPFRARVFGSDARGKETERLELRDNGRSVMWAGVAKSAAESPIIGKGLGTSEGVVSDTYRWVGHPHNDFLRLWHDLGAIGLAFFLASLAMWSRTLWRAWILLRDRASHQPLLQLAAISALIALVIGMLTDNSLVYGFVVAPTAVVIGAGLGAGSQVLRRRRKQVVHAVSLTPASGADGPGAAEGDPTLDQPAQRFRVRKRKRRR